MTIIVTALGDSLAVIASDGFESLYSRTDGTFLRGQEIQKIYIYGKQPVAVGVAGLARIGGRQLLAFVKERVDDRRLSGSALELANDLGNHLQPLIMQEVQQAASDVNGPPVYGSTLFVASAI